MSTLDFLSQPEALALLTGSVSLLSRDEVEKHLEGMSGPLCEIVSRVKKVNRKHTVPGSFQGQTHKQMLL